MGRVAMKTARDELLTGRFGEQITGKLFHSKCVERQVCIEGAATTQSR